MEIKALIISDYRGKVSSRPEAELFIRLARKGMDITIMTFPEADYIEDFKDAGIKIINYHPEKKISLYAIRTIREELVKGNYNILHLFNRRSITNGILAARKLPVKVVLYRGYTGGIRWYEPSSYLKYLHPRVDKVMCLASSIEDLLHSQLFFKKSKAVTINKGHLPEWYDHIKPANKKDLNIPENAFLITCVANSRKMKGVPYLMKATCIIPENLPIHIMLIGNNMDAKAIMSERDKSPYKNNIHIPGFRNDALNIVAGSDMFILPSIFGEATTKALIEALSLGKPTVTTSITGNRDLARHEISAYVVPPRNPEKLAEGIMKLYNDAQYRTQLGIKAKEFVQKNFHTDRTVEGVKKMYEDLVSELG